MTTRDAIRKAMWGSLAILGACGGRTVTYEPEPVPPLWTLPARPDLGQPTPVPTGPIYLENAYTPDGLPHSSVGKCFGVTVKANEETVFAADARVLLGPKGPVPVRFVDPYTLRVGDAATHHACFFTKHFDPPGDWDLAVHSGTEVFTLPAAVRMDPPVLHDVGVVDWTEIWSRDRALDPAANTFEMPFDVDIYQARFGYEVYDHMEFFNVGSREVVPIMELWEEGIVDAYTARGGFGLVFPMNGRHYIVVKDAAGMGGPGADYDLSFVGDPKHSTHASDTCAGATEILPGTYYADYDSLSNDYDPAGRCLDSVWRNPIRAPGGDAVWKVRVPAGMELRVSTYDDHIDNTTYLLPVGSPCDPRPSNCVAASGRFGGGNTDTLIYENRGTVDEEFLLVHDSATVMSSGVGAFLMNVKLYDK